MLDVGHTTEGTRTIQELFGEKLFPFSKPVSLVRELIQQGTSPSSHDIILDFFAGSGTTAEAVFEQNRQDGGNRQVILVQLPEPTGRDDYPTIADIAKERIRRVIKGLNDEGIGKLILEEEGTPDRGFRVFKLDQSNFTTWDAGSSMSRRRWSGSLSFTSSTSAVAARTTTSSTSCC